MKTQSAKAKGRSLQKIARDYLRAIGTRFGLEEGDIESRGMGQNGTDVILSPAAIRAVGNLAIECKNHEKLNVVSIFWQHALKYKTALVLLIHKKNYTDPLVTMRLSDFFTIYSQALESKEIERAA